MVKDVVRTELLQVRVTADEKAMLSELAEADGLTLSQVVRQLARAAHRKRFGEPTKSRTRK